MCGNSMKINHSLCYTSDIWKLTFAISVLNHWSKSHTVSSRSYLITLISVIHWDSDWAFQNSKIIAHWISSRDFCGVPTSAAQNFMNQSRAWSLRVVIIHPFFILTLCTMHTIQTSSQRNQCCSGSSVPFHLKVGSLMFVPSIRVVLGLFTGFRGFIGFTGTADGLLCTPVLTLGLWCSQVVQVRKL